MGLRPDPRSLRLPPSPPTTSVRTGRPPKAGLYRNEDGGIQHTNTYTITHTHANTHARTLTHTHTHIRTHARAQTRTHTHARTHTHTHTHTLVIPRNGATPNILIRDSLQSRPLLRFETHDYPQEHELLLSALKSAEEDGNAVQARFPLSNFREIKNGCGLTAAPPPDPFRFQPNPQGANVSPSLFKARLGGGAFPVSPDRLDLALHFLHSQLPDLAHQHAPEDERDAKRAPGGPSLTNLPPPGGWVVRKRWLTFLLQPHDRPIASMEVDGSVSSQEKRLPRLRRGNCSI